jgi:hypothetical protein
MEALSYLNAKLSAPNNLCGLTIQLAPQAQIVTNSPIRNVMRRVSVTGPEARTAESAVCEVHAAVCEMLLDKSGVTI